MGGVPMIGVPSKRRDGAIPAKPILCVDACQASLATLVTLGAAPVRISHSDFSVAILRNARSDFGSPLTETPAATRWLAAEGSSAQLRVARKPTGRLPDSPTQRWSALDGGCPSVA